MRFYDPQQGSVEIDGHDVRELTLGSVSRAIGLVLQETYLFHASLRENLLYANPDADHAALEAAIELVQPTGSRSYATFRLADQPVGAGA